MGETVEQACGSINAVDDAYNAWFISINGVNYAENITSAAPTQNCEQSADLVDDICCKQLGCARQDYEDMKRMPSEEYPSCHKYEVINVSEIKRNSDYSRADSLAEVYHTAEDYYSSIAEVNETYCRPNAVINSSNHTAQVAYRNRQTVNEHTTEIAPDSLDPISQEPSSTFLTELKNALLGWLQKCWTDPSRKLLIILIVIGVATILLVTTMLFYFVLASALSSDSSTAPSLSPTSVNTASVRSNAFKSPSTETFVFATDDIGSLFMDDKLIVNTKFFYRAVHFSTNNKSKFIAVHVQNVNLYAASNIGFILQSSSGIVTDHNWKCTSSVPKNEWAKFNFDDSSWGAAVCYARNGDGFYPLDPIKNIAPNTCWISTTSAEVPFMANLYCRKTLINLSKV